MKATELMIGDWVEFHQSDGQGFYAQVEALNNDGTFSESGFYADNDVSPIPLTAEILEKNKFSIFGESHYVLFNKDMTIKFSLYFPSKDNYWLIIGHRKYSIRSVHELQHTLRLCEIEKEIEL